MAWGAFAKKEPFARGPVQLSKDEVLHAFDGTGLVCKDIRISGSMGFQEIVHSEKVT